MMTWNDFAASSGLDTDTLAVWKPHWEKLSEGWNGELPYFLDRTWFETHLPYCNAPFPAQELLAHADAILETARRNPVVSLMAYMLHRGAFVLQSPVFPPVPGNTLALLGEHSGMFSFMISLGVFPQIRETHRRLGLPDQYATDILRWIGGSMPPFAIANNGLPGRPFAFNWIRHYVDGTLFRIGRLEYLVHPYRIDWLPAIYRNKKKELAVLCRNWHFREDGYRVRNHEPYRYETRLVIEKDRITGTPVPPDGFPPFGQEMTLDLNQWQPIASPWDTCPSIHIPGGEKMPFASVRESLLLARDFFRTHFHIEVPLFSCCSWILNPVWEELYEHSNMAEFRKQFYDIPAEPWGNKGGMSFLFGRDDVSPLDLPAVNTAQKAFQEAFRRNKCGAGGLFVPADEIEKTGDCYYRRKYGKLS